MLSWLLTCAFGLVLWFLLVLCFVGIVTQRKD